MGGWVLVGNYLMKSKEITSLVIAAENEALVLSEGRQRVAQELADVKDLMRKLREKDVQLPESTYCFSHGVPIKKKPKELYPFLEKKCKQLTALRAQYDAKLNAELKTLVDLMKGRQLSGGEVDGRVRELLREYELGCADE